MSVFSSLFPSRSEMESLPPLIAATSGTAASGGAAPKISLLIPARNAADSIEHTLRHAYRELHERHAGDFEIILIPNPKPGDTADRTEEVGRALLAELPGLRVVPHLHPPGKGAAMRTGFQAARGTWIFFTDADLPYELEFFARAEQELERGFDLVTGNRRLPTSHFDVPVSLLPIAYGRHRLGLFFNLAVRLLFPIPTTDTQAGIKAMSRRLAQEAFRLQACPGFFFDLEIFLAALRNSFQTTELPVILRLNSEKSTVRLVRESILAIFWLGKLARRDRRGAYRRVPTTQRTL